YRQGLVQRSMFYSHSVIWPVTPSRSHRQYKCDSVAWTELAIQGSESLVGWRQRNRLIIQQELRRGAPAGDPKRQRKRNRLLCVDSEINFFLKRIICFFVNFNHVARGTDFGLHS